MPIFDSNLSFPCQQHLLECCHRRTIHYVLKPAFSVMSVHVARPHYCDRFHDRLHFADHTDQDVSRCYSAMDGRHTLQSRRPQTASDREVELQMIINMSTQQRDQTAEGRAEFCLVMSACCLSLTRSLTLHLQVSHKQMTQLILFSLLHQKQPARAIYDFKAQSAK